MKSSVEDSSGPTPPHSRAIAVPPTRPAESRPIPTPARRRAIAVAPTSPAESDSWVSRRISGGPAPMGVWVSDGLSRDKAQSIGGRNTRTPGAGGDHAGVIHSETHLASAEMDQPSTV